MNYFTNATSHNLGTVKVGEKKQIKYLVSGGAPEIRKVKPGCGCTKVKVVSTSTGRQVIATYTPEKFPRHLDKNEYYTAVKTLEVFFVTGETIGFEFIARVIK